MTFPPLAVHSSALAVSIQPWPLQPFLPAHSWPPPAQPPFPAQLLAPWHLTFAAGVAVPPALGSAFFEEQPAANRPASAAATSADVLFMCPPLTCIRGRRAPCYPRARSRSEEHTSEL